MSREARWFTLYRREWITEMLNIYGFINRSHLMKKFGISMPQASIDLKQFQKSYPRFVRYDLSKKCYVRQA